MIFVIYPIPSNKNKTKIVHQRASIMLKMFFLKENVAKGVQSQVFLYCINNSLLLLISAGNVPTSADPRLWVT